MSGRTVSPFTLAVALLVGAVAPAAAQEGGFQTPPNSGGPPPAMTPPEPPVPTMTPPAPPPMPTDVRVKVGQGVRITVPSMGSLPLSFDGAFPLAEGARNHRQMFNFSVGLFGDGVAVCPAGLSGGFGSYCAPALPRLAAPAAAQQLTVFGPGSIRLVAAEDVLTCPPCPLPKIVPNPLTGTWYREVPGLGFVVAVTFAHDELKLFMTQSADGHAVTVTATAHYTITPDGLVFGAITGADVDVKSGPGAGESPFGMDLAELSMVIQALVDAPFSARTKMTSAGLMVSGVKCGLAMGRSEAEQFQAAFGGLFKCAKDGKVPAPAAPKPNDRVGGMVPPPVHSQYVIERVGVDFSSNPPTMNLPVQPAPCPVQPVEGMQFGPPVLSKIPYVNRLFKNVGPDTPPCPMPEPVRPVGSGVPGGATKQLAEDAFAQLLQQSGVTRPVGGMTLPAPRYLEHFPQYFPPEPAFPLPRELACPEAGDVVVIRRAAATAPVGPTTSVAPLPKPVAVGTWYRDVAGKQCVVKVTPDHLTLTVHDAQEVDGKVSTASLVITADYHLTRDGITAVGLITSVDVNFEGDFPPEDSKSFFEMLAELQKVLEDKPFALTFRAYGDALVIGNVRMPQVSDRMEVQPAGYMAGRYKAAGDKIPKPKPTKMPSEPKALGGSVPPSSSGFERGSAIGGPKLGAPGALLPPAAYPEGVPLLPPPPLPSAPNSDLLPPQKLPPAQAPRIVPSGGSDTWAPPMSEPTRPVPQMPQPTPPGEVKAVAPRGEWWNSDTAPTVRMQQLLYSQEGDANLRQIHNEWRRFWFNDQPSHLTPERIHGGIN